MNKETAIRFPELYKTVLKSRDLSIVSLMQWIWKSVLQGTTIFLCAIYFFDEAFLEIVTITFSALIFCELLMTYFEVDNYNKLMILGQCLSFGSYAFCALLLHSSMNFSRLDYHFFLKTTLITCLAVLPVACIKKLRKMVAPNDYENVIQMINRQK